MHLGLPAGIVQRLFGVQRCNPPFQDTQLNGAFHKQCGERGVDPVICSFGSVVSFPQRLHFPEGCGERLLFWPPSPKNVLCYRKKTSSDIFLCGSCFSFFRPREHLWTHIFRQASLKLLSLSLPCRLYRSDLLLYFSSLFHISSSIKELRIAFLSGRIWTKKKISFRINLGKMIFAICVQTRCIWRISNGSRKDAWPKRSHSIN